MSDLDVTVVEPRYDRAALRPRILHLGFGAFGRAHPMWFLDHGLDKVGGDWGVIAARLRYGVEGLDALDAAQGRYHVAAADGATALVRCVGCVIGTRHPARDGSDALPDLIATSGIDVILLTVTEKGYCQTDGRLDTRRADVQADIRNPTAPGTAIGVLAEGLRRRRDAGGAPLTVLSCDNVPDNGALLREVILDFSERTDPELARWIADNAAFPGSMVDRITPAMDSDGRALIQNATGKDDANGIVTEPFHQWVIEDRFAGPRPPFAEAGAELVADVRPYEEMKLRMLNGAHTFLAQAGRLAGHETVAQAIADPVLRDSTRRLMLNEQAATLDMPEGVDLVAYADALIARFDNTRLRHRLDQIAQDTSQKIPQRLLVPALANWTAGRPWPLTALAIASWIVALRKLPDVADPRHDALCEAAAHPDPVGAVLTLPGLSESHAPLIGPVRAAHDTIAASGIETALKDAA